MKGGIFVGPLPESSKPLSRPSAIKNKKEALEAQALQDHLDPDDNKVYDDLLTEVNTANPNSFATFARGKAIALLTKENLQKLMNTSTTYNRPLQDPITRQPFHAEVLAWVTQINEEGPFKLTMIMPVEHRIIKLTANANYLTLVDSQGNFTLYNKDIEEEVFLEAPAHNSVFVTEDGKHAITYNYLMSSIPVGIATDKVLPKMWTITPEEATSKDLKSELNPAVKGAFITPDNKFYLYTTGESFTRWGLTKANNLTKATIVKQKDLYRPDKAHPMQIHYTNNKLIYYNPTAYFISYVTRNEDNTFSVLCENMSYVNTRTNDVSPIAFSLDGTLIATYVRHFGKIQIHDITQAEPALLKELSPPIVGYQETSLALSADKKYLFVAYSNLVLVYDISATPKLVQKIQVGEKLVRTMYGAPPAIRIAYFNGFVVAAIGTLVYFFREE